MAGFRRCRPRLTPQAMGATPLILALAACTAPQPNTGMSETAARLQLAQMAQAAGDSRQETALLADAAASEPDNPTVQLRYAAALADARRNKEALEAARPAFQRHNDNTALGLLTGRLQLRLEQSAAAAATYQSVLSHAPNDPEALNGLGIAKVMQGKPAEAEPLFKQAAAAAPADTVSLNNLALSLALQGKTDEAIPMLQTLMQQNADSRQIRSNLALAYAIAGNRQDALGLLLPIMTSQEAEQFLADYARVEHGASPEQPLRLARSQNR